MEAQQVLFMQYSDVPSDTYAWEDMSENNKTYWQDIAQAVADEAVRRRNEKNVDIAFAASRKSVEKLQSEIARLISERDAAIKEVGETARKLGHADAEITRLKDREQKAGELVDKLCITLAELKAGIPQDGFGCPISKEAMDYWFTVDEVLTKAKAWREGHGP